MASSSNYSAVDSVSSISINHPVSPNVSGIDIGDSSDKFYNYLIFIYVQNASPVIDEYNHILSSVKHRTPNGSRLWFPVVPDALNPVVDSVYPSYDYCLRFYESYAEFAGFDVKKASFNRLADGTINYVVFRCIRSGVPKRLAVDTLVNEPCVVSNHVNISKRNSSVISNHAEAVNNKSKRQSRKGKEVVDNQVNDEHSSNKAPKFANRKSSTIKCGCEASLRCKYENSKIFVFKFFEGHNHVSEANKNSLNKKRKMQYFDMNFVQDLASKFNIGPMLAHLINCDISGGYDMVGPTNVDYKNFRRDLLRHVGETDAHIVIENLLRKKEVLPDFTCEYRCDVEGCLTGGFWADQLSKMNYKEFGDIVSFDATYGTNRYNMRFVPITGIDNHKKLVIFGAALLSRETIDSYKQFIDCFLKTFSNEHGLVTTDQDPAVLEAVAEKFKTAKHRICMWHISQKLKDKVGYVLYNNNVFRKRMNYIFWNKEMSVSSFERHWKSLIEDFELDGAKWFDDMYAIKEMWIPCFFRDVPMNGLMRTSSLSESENSFFSKCKNKHSNLVDFFSRFDVAMDKQRHNTRLIDSQMESRSIKCRTVKSIEVHARDMYTPTFFLLVQDEIFQSDKMCSQISCATDGDDELKKIIEVQKKFIPPRRLCRHIFHVYEINDIFQIPKQHILRRWTRDASESLNVIFAGVNYHSDAYMITKHLSNTFRRVVSNCKNDKEILHLFSDKFDGFVKEFAPSIPDQHSSVTKVQQIENVLGFSKPSNVKVRALVVVPKKGQRNNIDSEFTDSQGDDEDVYSDNGEDYDD
ncbi:protein FAR1-RELATED SEQUENCE 5-like [Rutidosis leptorrhynchoides]|uniref:protein FAR1-RELATED SEQUENCE 5-like n=1 Tax=Rutidosis leptorrhynchoides TaxID=125765 RepID=UPI003A999580